MNDDVIKRGALWIPVDVELLDSAGNKFGLNDAAVLAYLRLIAWCKRKRKDGLIPFSVAPSILNGCASDLEAAGLIATDDDDHVVIRDWHKWHDSADELAERREADRERQRRHRERREAMPSKNSSPSPKEKRRGEERQTRDSRVSHGVTDTTTWDVVCRHGAPHNGRGCIECRTGQDIGR